MSFERMKQLVNQNKQELLEIGDVEFFILANSPAFSRLTLLI